MLRNNILICLTDILLAPGEENNESSDEEGEEIQLEMVELTIGTLDLREHEMHPCRRRKRRRKKKEQGKLHNQGWSSSV